MYGRPISRLLKYEWGPGDLQPQAIIRATPDLLGFAMHTVLDLLHNRSMHHCHREHCHADHSLFWYQFCQPPGGLVCADICSCPGSTGPILTSSAHDVSAAGRPGLVHDMMVMSTEQVRPISAVQSRPKNMHSSLMSMPSSCRGLLVEDVSRPKATVWPTCWVRVQIGNQLTLTGHG